MTVLERIKVRLSPAEDVSDDLLNELLQTAQSIIQTRRYPYGEIPETLEPRYEDLQLRIAVELYAKLDAEGELSHSEGGISRSYASAMVTPELLWEVTPKVGVL